MSAFPYSTPKSWSELLTETLQRPVEVRFGNARRQVIVVQDRQDVLTVRMNAVFGEAPPDVANAVARWMNSGRRARNACRRLDEWIAEVEPRLKPARPPRLRHSGQHYDLLPIMEAVGGAEFVGTHFKHPTRGITWGRRTASRAHRSLQLGSFDPDTGIIRIHTVLDQPAVPAFFVRYVIFHELLHAALGDEPAGPTGRRPHHGPEFRRIEEAYCDYQRAIDWQDANISALMRSARSGRPLKRSIGSTVAKLVEDKLSHLAEKQLWLF